MRRIEADGTRVYDSYNRYRPVPLEERKIGVNKPDDPRAKRFHGQWFLPLDVLPDDARPSIPATSPWEDPSPGRPSKKLKKNRAKLGG